MHYSEQVKRAVQISQSLAKEYYNSQFAPAHLLMALLHNDIGIASTLVSIGKDIHYLREWAEVRMEGVPKDLKFTDEPQGDAQISKYLRWPNLWPCSETHK